MEFDKNKIKTKIAISKIKEENDIVMENKTKGIFKMVTTGIAGIVFCTGVVFAGSKIIENIWKEPKKIETPTYKITEESKKENITEEEAKQIAIKKLNEFGFNSNITGTDHYKEINSNKIMYRFKTEGEYEISIDGKKGTFYQIWTTKTNIEDKNIILSKEEFLKIADKYNKIFGYINDDYEMTRIDIIGDKIVRPGEEVNEGFRASIGYRKKYGDSYNPYESISIVIESKNKELDSYRVENIPYENNEVIITSEEAIKIALEEDKKIETNKIIETRAEKQIVKTNANAYYRINDRERYYKSMQTQNYPDEERNYYEIDERVRNAWIVYITYEDNFGESTVRRYTEGKFAYYVDCTTGEIIGGNTSYNQKIDR